MNGNIGTCQTLSLGDFYKVIHGCVKGGIKKKCQLYPFVEKVKSKCRVRKTKHIRICVCDPNEIDKCCRQDGVYKYLCCDGVKCSEESRYDVFVYNTNSKKVVKIELKLRVLEEKVKSKINYIINNYIINDILKNVFIYCNKIKINIPFIVFLIFI